MSDRPAVSKTDDSSPAFGEIWRHPAERGDRLPRSVVLYSCCCCCCCCLHTLGAAVGVAVAGNFQTEPRQTNGSTKRYPSCQGIYWSSLLGVIVVSAVLGALYSILQWSGAVSVYQSVAQTLSTGTLAFGFALILLGPLWLLAASLVAAARIKWRRDLPGRDLYWRQLGSITSRMIIGTVLGVIVMVVIGVLFAGVF